MPMAEDMMHNGGAIKRWKKAVRSATALRAILIVSTTAVEMSCVMWIVAGETEGEKNCELVLRVPVWARTSSEASTLTFTFTLSLISLCCLIYHTPHLLGTSQMKVRLQ